VRRASHVEFDEKRQMWYVREAVPRGLVRRLIQRVVRRPVGRIIARSRTRHAALQVESAFYQPGGRGWPLDSR